jgi:hypothetical protein
MGEIEMSGVGGRVDVFALARRVRADFRSGGLGGDGEGGAEPCRRR